MFLVIIHVFPLLNALRMPLRKKRKRELWNYIIYILKSGNQRFPTSSIS